MQTEFKAILPQTKAPFHLNAMSPSSAEATASNALGESAPIANAKPCVECTELDTVSTNYFCTGIVRRNMLGGVERLRRGSHRNSYGEYIRLE